ncbi:hypothetical protein MYU51_000351 [Penicillium brevicompactum]|uniref:Uncharacterized protein n=1 Tax=Penicillium brevicompactum TaxID=5074 RepID=A0A9W9UFX8_PENBR|nr:uncharacterized protein N7506_008681 [Penicillium brevicompactum]KAJ5325579.1 hypothetical protein N7506_008681 [Penicillium brevicompactum]KAJ5339648.1 hypothetical protein N7452_006376 [Penicillium brevicompactum]
MPMPTQDAATRAKESATQKASHSDMGPTELLSEHMDASGNPVPDDAWDKTQKSGKTETETDPYEAMNAETADFD